MSEALFVCAVQYMSTKPTPSDCAFVRIALIAVPNRQIWILGLRYRLIVGVI